MSKERLDKIIASSGLMTRSEVKTLIKKGLVKVNNSTVKDASLKCDCETDDIIVDGKIGYMFQKDNLFEWRNVYKNITIGSEIKRIKIDEKEIEKLEKEEGKISN